MTARHVVVLIAVMIVVRAVRVVMMTARLVAVSIGIMTARLVVVLIAVMIVVRVVRVVMMTAQLVAVSIGIMIGRLVVVSIAMMTVVRVAMTIARQHNVDQLRCTNVLGVARLAAGCRIHPNVPVKTGLMKVLRVPHVVLLEFVQRPLVVHKKVDAKKYVLLML
jgi:hypothetical protein